MVFGCKVSPLLRSIFIGQNADLTSGLTLHPNTIFEVFLIRLLLYWQIYSEISSFSYIRPCFGAIIKLVNCYNYSEMIPNIVENPENKWFYLSNSPKSTKSTRKLTIQAGFWPYKRANLLIECSFGSGPAKNWPYKRVDLTSVDHTIGLHCIGILCTFLGSWNIMDECHDVDLRG